MYFANLYGLQRKSPDCIFTTSVLEAVFSPFLSPPVQSIFILYPLSGIGFEFANFPLSPPLSLSQAPSLRLIRVRHRKAQRPFCYSNFPRRLSRLDLIMFFDGSQPALSFSSSPGLKDQGSDTASPFFRSFEFSVSSFPFSKS